MNLRMGAGVRVFKLSGSMSDIYKSPDSIRTSLLSYLQQEFPELQISVNFGHENTLYIDGVAVLEFDNINTFVGRAIESCQRARVRELGTSSAVHKKKKLGVDSFLR